MIRLNFLFFMFTISPLKRLFFTLFFCIASSANATETLQTLHSKITAQQQKITEKLNDKKALQAKLERLNATLDQHSQSLKALQAKLKKNKAQQKTTLAKKTKLGKTLSKQKQQLAKVVNAIYQTNLNPSFAEKLLASDKDPNKTVLKHYLQTLYQQKAQLLQASQQTQDTLTATEKTLVQQQKDYQQQLDTAENLRQQQAKLQTEQKHTLQALERSIQQEQKKLAQLKRNEENLRASIIAAQKAAEKERQAQKQRALLALTKHNLNKPKHQYPWPVKGKVLYQFGTPQLGELLWKGVVIKATKNQEVRAIAAGKVLLADKFNGYGKLIIVQHGTQDLTLYGYNNRLLVKKGDIVRAGQTIALVGHLPSHSLRGKTGLYFEISHRGKSLNPLRWLKK